MVEVFDVCVEPLTGDTPRRAYVYLPENYDPEAKRRYPVLYMFDGHNVFFDEDATYGTSWGMGEYLDAMQADLIVAAVECNHEGNGRLREYSPVSLTYNGEKLRPQGRETMDWLVNEFKPYIDSQYLTFTGPEHTGICGSSMGGLMALYAACFYSDVFGNIAALSPSLWVGGKAFQGMLDRAKIAEGTRVYMDYGSEEFNGRKGSMKLYRKTTDTLLKKGVFLTSRIVPDGTHCEASWNRQIPVFMSVLGMF